MFQSQKISDHFKAPKKRFEGNLPFTHKIHLDLSLLGLDLFVYLELKDEGEQVIRNVRYETSGPNEFLGMIDLYFQLIEGRALESLDRVTAKEFDYFLRDDTKEGIFEFYDDKFYEILSIGEEILKSIRPKDDFKRIFDGGEEEFFDLSFSSQLEIFEEFFADTVYKHPKFHTIEYDVLDVKTYQITLSLSSLSSDLDFYLRTEVQDRLGLKKTELIILEHKEITN